MEGKLCIVCCLLVTVLIVQVTGQTCPTNFHTRRGRCPTKRCTSNADCSGLEVCCILRYCNRRCILPEPDVVNGRLSNETPLTESSPVPSQTIESNQQIVHSGKCMDARSINCGVKLSCSSDGQCKSTEKCCPGNCGRKVCAASLRSSIFSIFSGK